MVCRHSFAIGYSLLLVLVYLPLSLSPLRFSRLSPPPFSWAEHHVYISNSPETPQCVQQLRTEAAALTLWRCGLSVPGQVLS